MITITVANQKGGVGKTTTAVTLAHGLARVNFNTLVMDLDPQGQCASLLQMNQERNVYRFLVDHRPLQEVALSTGRDHLWLMPGNKETHIAQVVNLMRGRGKELLKELLDTPRIGGDQLHYVVLDTAPTVGELMQSALFAADILLIPSAMDHLSLDGVKGVLDTLQELRRPMPPKLLILPTFYDEVTRESKANLELLRQNFAPQSLLVPIHRATIMRECAALGQTVFEAAPESRTAQEYQAVAKGVAYG